MEVLKKMCAIHAPSGNEGAMTRFILDYIKKNQKNWKVQPVIHAGKGFQDCIVLAFGKPRTAIFAHLDSIGFTVRYGTQLVKIGGPRTITGMKLVGRDSGGKVEARLIVNEDGSLAYSAKRELERGTELTFKPEWREDKNFVQCCYMDNRLGVWSALQVAETLTDGIIAFSCYEEHGGGSVSFLQKFINKEYGVTQALISDISWVTDGVPHGKGPVISLRDSLIPRRSYIDKIIKIAQTTGIPYQLEVEGTGGSDAKELQMAETPWDWCFIGAPEDNVHTPDEKVHKKDISNMVKLYAALMAKL
jgi:putative aminopeptidase FrvX